MVTPLKQTVGYCQQAFSRVCVRESLQHGKENAPFLQRADARRTQHGRATLSRKVETGSPIPPMPSVYEATDALCKSQGAPQHMLCFQFNFGGAMIVS